MGMLTLEKKNTIHIFEYVISKYGKETILFPFLRNYSSYLPFPRNAIHCIQYSQSLHLPHRGKIDRERGK